LENNESVNKIQQGEQLYSIDPKHI
jgi:hypothetical protein